MKNKIHQIDRIFHFTNILLVKEIANRWSPEHVRALTRVKQLLVKAHVLHFRDFSISFVIHVDASDAGAGALLAQQNGDDLSITAYFS